MFTHHMDTNTPNAAPLVLKLRVVVLPSRKKEKVGTQCSPDYTNISQSIYVTQKGVYALTRKPFPQSSLCKGLQIKPNQHNCSTLSKNNPVNNPLLISVQDNEYILVNSSTLSWQEAEKFCNKYNSHLASIPTENEASTIQRLFYDGNILTPHLIYIGLQRKEKVTKTSYYIC